MTVGGLLVFLRVDDMEVPQSFSARMVYTLAFEMAAGQNRNRFFFLERYHNGSLVHKRLKNGLNDLKCPISASFLNH